MRRSTCWARDMTPRGSERRTSISGSRTTTLFTSIKLSASKVCALESARDIQSIVARRLGTLPCQALALPALVEPHPLIGARSDPAFEKSLDCRRCDGHVRVLVSAASQNYFLDMDAEPRAVQAIDACGKD